MITQSYAPIEVKAVDGITIDTVGSMTKKDLGAKVKIAIDDCRKHRKGLRGSFNSAIIMVMYSAYQHSNLDPFKNLYSVFDDGTVSTELKILDIIIRDYLPIDVGYNDDFTLRVKFNRDEQDNIIIDEKNYEAFINATYKSDDNKARIAGVYALTPQRKKRVTKSTESVTARAELNAELKKDEADKAQQKLEAQKNERVGQFINDALAGGDIDDDFGKALGKIAKAYAELNAIDDNTITHMNNDAEKLFNLVRTKVAKDARAA